MALESIIEVSIALKLLSVELRIVSVRGRVSSRGKSGA